MKLFGRPLLKSHKIPLFLLLFGSFGSAILGDSTAEALLLARLGSEYVPRLFLINAAFLFLLSTLIMSVIDRWDRGNMFIVFIGVHSCVLFLIRVALGADMPILFLFLFSYAYVTKILLFLLFWTLTNDLIDSRRAGTDFPFIAAGGTLGAICCAFAIPYLVKVLPAENLLLIWTGTSLATGLLFLPIKQSFGVSFKPVSERYRRVSFGLAPLLDDLKLVKTDPMLRSMALFYFLLFFIVLNQHYSFYSQLQNHLASSENQAEALARFLGFFNGISMVTTFLLQMTITGVVIRKAGSTRAMFIMPIALCVVFGTLAVMMLFFDSSSSPLIFWGVVVGVGTRIAFFDSFFSPNFQIFFSSLPQNIRGRGKLSIEGVVKPLAMVFAGIWLVVAAPRIPLLVQTLILLGVSVVILNQTRQLKHKYTASLAQYLRGFKSKNTQLLKAISSAGKETLFLDLVENVLRKEEPNVKAYVIDMLATMESPEAIQILVNHMPQADSKTRATIVSALGGLKGSDDAKKVFMEYLGDQDLRVVANCIDALANYRDPEIYREVERFCSHESPRIRANAVAALWPYASAEKREELSLQLRHMMEMGYPTYTASALYAMGHVNFPNLVGELQGYYEQHPFWVTTDRPVWRQFVLALASVAQDEAVDVLLKVSDVAGRKQRNQVSIALGLLINKGVSIDSLLGRLKDVDYMKRSVLLKALHVRAFERKKGTIRSLQQIGFMEIRAIYSHWVAYSALSTGQSNPGLVLLRHAIMEECINESLRNLFYIASMLDGGGQIRRIVHRLFHSNKRVRSQALEVLDNAGDFRTNRAIVKLLETNNPEVHSREAMTLYKLKGMNSFSVVNEYAGCPNTWVRECCSYATQCLFATSAG